MNVSIPVVSVNVSPGLLEGTFWVVGHGEGDALGDFAFSLSAVGHVVFQHGHARVGNGLLHGLRGPFGTIGLLFAGGDESCGLGVKVGVGVKGVEGFTPSSEPYWT